MSQVVDVIAPPRFGHAFRRLIAAAWASDLGDGIALAAGPLLVVSQTRDPFLIALATLLQRLPWVVFGLYAGVIADRHDRRAVIVLANAARVAVLVLVSVMVVTDTLTVTATLVALTALGSAEVFVDTTKTTLLPMLVDPSDLGVANSRLMFGRITINRLAGPAIGAALFAAGMAIPFVVQAVCVAFAVLMIRGIVVDRPTPPDADVTVRSDIVAGMRWVWRHPAIRTLTITVLGFNITFGAIWSILVLYSVERLGLGAFGFGLLTSFGAAGGIVTSLGYGWIERRLGMTNIMRVGLLVETGMHLVLALTTSPAVAFGMFFLVGMHEAAWGTTVVTIRQRAVPNEFQGRVSSVYMVGVFGSLAVGALIGGAIAGVWGVTAPFWFGFAGSAMILASIWRRLDSLVAAE